MKKTNRLALSRYLNRVIEQKGLKLRDIERRVGKGITNSYISKILTGNATNLTVEKIAVLARGLEIDGREIFDAAYGQPDHLKSGSQSNDAVDAVALMNVMREVALKPQLMAIVQEVVQLRREEYSIVHRYLVHINEAERKPQSSRQRSRRKKKSV